jgi:hypothetical protein
MAVDFDEFPLDDKVLNLEGLLSGVWRGSMSTFFQTLIGYLSQNGIFVPKLTNDQLNQIQTPELGQLIYNTTIDKLQAYENGAWQNLI